MGAKKGPRAYNRLTDRAIRAAKPGAYCDGQGLWLHVSESGARKWILRFSFDRRVHEMGLGNAHDVGLADARANALAARRLAASGVNPIEARRAHARAAQTAKTFGECADALIQSKRSGWRSDKHARQWAATLETYAKQLGGMPVADVGTAAVLSVLKPHWQRVPETANRLRGRIEAVLDYAKAHGWRSGENPAAWRGHLALILSKRQKLERKHLEAMAFEDIPAFVDKLRTMDSIAARALELAILTAARTGEIIGMRWGEVDFENRVWTVPGSRMKAGISHRVPLSAPAIALLESMAQPPTGMRSIYGMPNGDKGQLVFRRPGRRPGPLRSDAMLALVEGATVHGMRSAFRNWCADVAQAPREIAEACLAHATGSAVGQAYLRTDVIERRRKLMESWGQFCMVRYVENVIAIRA